MDYEIGRVLDKIREVAPEAMVIFTSDHGDMLGAHRLFSKNAAAYKEVANIPLIIKGGVKGHVERVLPPTLILFNNYGLFWLEDSKTSGRQEHASGNLRSGKEDK